MKNYKLLMPRIALSLLLVSLLGCNRYKNIAGKIYYNNHPLKCTAVYFYQDSTFTIFEQDKMNYGRYLIKKQKVYLYTEESNPLDFICSANVLVRDSSVFILDIKSNKRLYWEEALGDDYKLFQIFDQNKMEEYRTIKCQGKEFIIFPSNSFLDINTPLKFGN